MNISGNAAPSSSRKSFLSDDIFVEILSRLPAKDVLRYRCVCRGWRDLISTNDFVDLHTQRGMRYSAPMILVQYCNLFCPIPKNYYIFLDKWWVKKAQIHRFQIHPDCHTCFSQDGFLILKCNDSKEIMILNPINGENVRIVLPIRLYWFTKVYGFFFNPTLKEYCALLGINSWKPENIEFPSSMNYTMLNLGCKPRWKEIPIRTPLNLKISIRDAPPILIHEYLYWMVRPKQEYNGDMTDIIQYNISTEVFTLLHGPRMKTDYFSYHTLDLLNIDGFLSLIGTRSPEDLVDVDIWTLKDRTEQLWTCSNYQFRREGHPVRALAVVDGELLIQCDERHYNYLVFNLKCGTIRKFENNNHTEYAIFFPHAVGLASLRKCKSKIYFEEEDESTEARSL